VKNNLVTGVTVTYNSKELLKTAYGSLRDFHPEMPIIIVDGSEITNDCHSYVASLKDKNTHPFQVGYNIGHGRGMCAGLYYVQTPYVLFFDSDIEVLNSPVDKMMNLFEEDTFGVGFIERTGFDGFDYGVKPNHLKEGWMPYLHPYFQLVQIKVYRQFHPYSHHGAPCVFTMLDIFKKGLSNKILKEFTGLGHTSGQGFSWKGIPREYVRHDVAGTRKICKKTNQVEIAGAWELHKEE
jgi:hypothetical protein